MADQLSLDQHAALQTIAEGPLVARPGRHGWGRKGDGRRGFQQDVIRGLEGHGLVTINGGKASITARGKRFLDAEGK